MSIPHRQQGLSRSHLLLGGLLAISLVAHIAVASIRHPVGPRYGDGIHGSPPNTTITPGELRIATWNIHRGKGLDGRRDLSRTVKYLRGFDIAGLNEVGGEFWPKQDQAATLGTRLHMGWLFDPTERRWYIDNFGNGLLSRLAPRKWLSLPLINDMTKYGDRHILYAHYVWQGRPFTLMVVHAEPGPIRDIEIRFIFRQFVRYPRAVLIGDFNALPTSPIMRQVHKLPGVQSALASLPSPPHLKQQRDWIFVRGFEVVNGGFKPRGPSDHPLVWATLRYPAAAG